MTYTNNLNEAVKKMVEKLDLESNYGWASCFDYPKEYERMEELAEEVTDLLEGNDTLYDIIKTIAFDVRNGNIDLEWADLHLYSQDEYIDTYIVEGMDEASLSMFNSLFYFMDSDHRSAWLESNYLAHDPQAYTDRFMETIVIVHQ